MSIKSSTWNRVHRSSCDPLATKPLATKTYITSTARPSTVPAFRSANTLLRFADFRANLAFGCECDCFGEIFAAADDRAADRNSIHDNIEDGRLNEGNVWGKPIR